MSTSHHAIQEAILPPTIHHRHPLHSTMTISAVVAVHLVAVALPGASNKGIDMRIFLLLLMLCSFQVFAERLPSVNDLTGTLTTEEQTALTQQLQTLEQQNHFQVAVLVTPTTGGKNIKLAASQRYGVYHWKPVGEKRYGEGILILVVSPEGLASMKIGHGLEEMLPPERALHQSTLPYAARFEKNNLFAGLTGGIESIAQFTHIKANISPLDA